LIIYRHILFLRLRIGLKKHARHEASEPVKDIFPTVQPLPPPEAASVGGVFHDELREQLRAGCRKTHEGAALVLPKPTLQDRVVLTRPRTPQECRLRAETARLSSRYGCGRPARAQLGFSVHPAGQRGTEMQRDRYVGRRVAASVLRRARAGVLQTSQK
jgi:hypothetical protein